MYTEKQTLRSFSRHRHHRVLYRLLLVINISPTNAITTPKCLCFVFLSVIYGCHCTDCGMFQCIFSLFFFIYIVLFCFLSLGCWIYSRARVILFVSLCNNIHFSLSVTFYFRVSDCYSFISRVCVFCPNW